jgi:hypothetical protein
VFPVRRGRCQSAPGVGRSYGGSSPGHRGHSEAAASARGADRHLRVLGLMLCDYDTIVKFFGTFNQNGRSCHPHSECGRNELGSILHWIIHSVLKFVVAVIQNVGGTRWRSWLRHSTTSRKIAGSIPDGVIGSFHWYNPSGRTMALGLTQPVTEISTRNISWG